MIELVARFFHRKARLLRMMSLLLLSILLLLSGQAVYAQPITQPDSEAGAYALWSLMQGSAAGIGIIVLVILAVLVLLISVLVWEIRRIVDDREFIKHILNGDTLLRDVFPFVARKTPTEMLSKPEQESFKTAIDYLLPESWAGQQTDQALDAIYDFLNDKKQESPNLALDLNPLFTALKGKDGRKAIRSMVDGLPNCPGRRVMPQPGLFGLPSCVPQGVNRRQITNQVQKGLIRELNKRLKGMGNISEFGIEQLDQILPQNPEEEESKGLAERFQEFRKSIIQTRRVSWILWAVAILTLLLIVYMASASITQIAWWVGWPIAISALLIFAVSYLMLMRIRNQYKGPGAVTPVASWLEVPLGLWERRVRIWSGGLLAAGIVLLLVGYFIPA